MIYIKVENLKSGQILARDVVDEKCRTLLKAGKEITETSKKIIIEKGYKGVYIDNCDKPGIYRDHLVDIINEFHIIQILESIYNYEYYNHRKNKKERVKEALVSP